MARGIAPDVLWLLSAGHSHRRTSGGKAEYVGPMTFEAKLITILVSTLVDDPRESAFSRGMGSRFEISIISLFGRSAIICA
jgi:hypothetical protein